MFEQFTVAIFGLPPQQRADLADLIAAHNGQVRYVPNAKVTVYP